MLSIATCFCARKFRCRREKMVTAKNFWFCVDVEIHLEMFLSILDEVCIFLSREMTICSIAVFLFWKVRLSR